MDNKLDVERTAKVISELKPDLVALQEVDRNADRSGKIDQVKELERLTGMNAVFGKTLGRSSGDYGIAILSRFPIVKDRYVQLPRHEKEEDRGVLETVVRLDEKRELRFLCTHFCHVHEGRRVKQAEMINELFIKDGMPTILGADFNATPDSATLKTLYGHWTDATNKEATFSGSNKKIDYILFHPQNALKVRKTQVIQDRVTSDHFPVLSIVELEQ